MRPMQRRRIVGLVAGSALLAGLANPAQAALPTGALQRVSDSGGTDAALDDTGTVVAYLSGASGDVMVGRARIVAGAGARELAISGDGTTVAFSTDRALAAGDANGTRDVYAVGRSGSGLRLVSSGLAGIAAFSPSVNGNGSVVAYSAGGVAAGAVREVFVRSGGGDPVKVPAPASLACDCIRPSISNDGNRVAFEVTDGGVHLWDRNRGVSTIEVRGGAGRPAMAGNGGSVAYQYQNTINVENLATGESVFAPVDGANPSLSADGFVVAFQATRALTGDSNNESDVVVFDIRDRLNAACKDKACVARVSTRPDGRTGDGGSFQPSLNANGTRVAFESKATNLVGGDRNGATDIFLRLPGDGAAPPPPPGRPGSGGGGGGSIPDIPDIPGAYWLVASDGGIFSFAGLGVDPAFYGSTGSITLNKPIVGMAAHPNGKGYWFVASDGGIFAFGDAGFYGSMGGTPLNKPIVGMAATPTGNGYWLVASDGGIFSFGDAGFYGSTGSITLNKPIVGMAATRTGDGYWFVASDGGLFAFGDAGFYGSMGDSALNKPVVGLAATPSGFGYYMVASDGGIFSFGDAGFYGSTGSITLNKPIVGMASTGSGRGYWFVASDGGIFSFGDAGFFGSMGGTPLNRPIVGMAGLT